MAIDGNDTEAHELLSVFRMPGPPDDNTLSPLDRSNIDNFSKLWRNVEVSVRAPVFFPSQLGSQFGVPLFHPGTIIVNSKAQRFAVSCLMSYLSGATTSNEYVLKYHQEAKRCIDQSSLVDLVFASYIVAVWSIIAGPSILTAISYCRQFSMAATILLRRSSKHDLDRQWIEMLWQALLLPLYYIHLDVILLEKESVENILSSIKEREQMLDDTLLILPTDDDILGLPRSMSTEVTLNKTLTLSIYLHYLLEHLLLRGIFDDFSVSERVEKSLRMVLARIGSLIPRLSNISDYIYEAYASEGAPSTADFADELRFLQWPKLLPRGLKPQVRERDTALVMLYAFAELLKKLLDQKVGHEEIAKEIRQSAIALCRLCATFGPKASPTAGLLIKRTLFWARMGLASSEFPRGTFCSFFSVCLLLFFSLHT